MPLVSQQGEVATRLRSFFRLTGRIPSTVDETVVPVSQVQALDVPPWRSSPIGGRFYNESAAVVAVQSCLGLGLPQANGGVWALRGIRAIQGTGGANHSLSIVMCSFADAIALPLVTDFGAIERIESMSQALLVGNIGDGCGLHLLVGSDATILLGFEIDRLRLGADATGAPQEVLWEGNVMLPAGGAVLLWGRNPNTTVRASFWAEYFPDVAPQP